MTYSSPAPSTGGGHSYPEPPAGMRGTPGPLLRIVKDQRLAFLVVGVANTAIGTGFYIFYLSLHVGGYIGALVMAHICAVLCAFVLYRHLVFRVRGHVLRDLARFEVVNLTALGINLLLLPFAVEVVGLGPLVGQLAVTGVTMFVTFFGHRDFSFRRKAGPKPAETAPTVVPGPISAGEV